MGDPSTTTANRLPWGALCLGGALLVCLMITAAAMYQAPEAVALGRRAIGSGLVMTLRDHEAPSRYWRAHILLDPMLAPPPAWSLDLMRDHTLHLQMSWDPDALSLIFRHAVPSVNNEVTMVVLGQVVLERSPQELWITRRDRRIELTCDRDPTLSQFIPTWVSAENRWRLVTAAPLGNSRVTVHLDRHLERAAVVDLENVTVLDRAHAEQLAQAACNELMGDPDRTAHAITAAELLGPGGRDLQWWLAWQQLRRFLATDNPPSADWDHQLAILTSADQQLSHGLLTSLLPALVERACAPPATALSPDEWLSQRQRWLLIAHDAAEALAQHPRPSPAIASQTAALVAHLTGALVGLDLAPTPADAPAWIADRWRLAAGRPALDETGALVIGNLPDDDIPPLLMTLLAHAGFEHPNALGATSLARQATANQPELAEAALGMVDGHDHWLLHGLLAVAGVVPANEARTLLNDAANGPAPTARHALAYTIDRLLAFRADEELTPFNPDLVPPALTAYTRLLDGRPGAPLLVTTLADDRLPPLQALAVALACQEMAGRQPDWSLLAAHRSLSLPLELLIPPSSSEKP